MTPLFYCILNEMDDIRQLLKKQDFYALEKGNQEEAAELLELLPRMRSVKLVKGAAKTATAAAQPDYPVFDESFKKELEGFYQQINFWETEMEHGDNFLHTLFREFDLQNPNGGGRDQAYITFDELYHDMKEKYKQEKTGTEEEFKAEIAKFMCEHNVGSLDRQTPLHVLIKNLNYSISKIDDKKKLYGWIEGWLVKVVLPEKKNTGGDTTLTDWIFKEFMEIYRRLSLLNAVETSTDKFSDEAICAIYDTFKEPQAEYNRILKDAVKKNALPVFEKYMKVDKYHEAAL